MGSQVILDLIASSLTFGTLLLMAIRLNGGVSESSQMYNGDLLVQSNIVTVIQMIEADFRRIGYCADPSKLPDPTKSILYADSNSIRYYTDLPISKTNMSGDGNLDIVYYYLGPTSELSMTPNPRDRFLYRVENNKPPRAANLGVTQFSLMYFTPNGTPFDDTLPSPVPAAKLGRDSAAHFARSIALDVFSLARPKPSLLC